MRRGERTAEGGREDGGTSRDISPTEIPRQSEHSNEAVLLLTIQTQMRSVTFHTWLWTILLRFGWNQKMQFTKQQKKTYVSGEGGLEKG